MSVYNTGTITITSGSTTVSGYGTEWDGEISVGDLLVKRGDSIAYTVAGIDTDTILTLKETYNQATASGQIYDIFRDFTANAGLPKVYGSDRSDWPVMLGDAFDKMDNWAIGWNKTKFTCTYASSTSFTASGDKTSLFVVDLRLKIAHGGGTTYHNVVSSSHSSGVTTVVIDGTISTPITTVHHSILVGGDSGSFPINFDQINLREDSSGYYLRVSGDSTPDLTASRDLIIDVKNANRRLTILGNSTIDQDVSMNGSPTHQDVTVNGLTAYAVTLANSDKKLTSLGTGTSGQILATSGSGANPYWAELPWQFEITPFISAFSNVNWGSTAYVAQLMGGECNSSGAQNDEIVWHIVLQAGTWNFDMLHHRDNNRGIYSVQFDGVEKGTIDGYVASGDTAQGSVIGIAVPTTAKIAFKLKMTTKNASSSNYYGSIQLLRFIRTS